MKIRQFLAFLLALCLLCAGLPLSAAAEPGGTDTTGVVWVDGNVLWGNSVDNPATMDHVAYNATTRTLTLNNYNAPKAGIYLRDVGQTITVVLNGANTIGQLVATETNLSITGTGTLVADYTMVQWGGFGLYSDITNGSIRNAIRLDANHQPCLMTLGSGITLSLNGGENAYGSAEYDLEIHDTLEDALDDHGLYDHWSTNNGGLVVLGKRNDSTLYIASHTGLSADVPPQSNPDGMLKTLAVFCQKKTDNTYAYWGVQTDSDDHINYTYTLYPLVGSYLGGFTAYDDSKPQNMGSTWPGEVDGYDQVHERGGDFGLNCLSGASQVLPDTTGAPVISTTVLEPATTGAAYSAQLTATPGHYGNTLTWSLAEGSTLPTGLTLAENGTLSGTVTVTKTTAYAFTVKVTESNGNTATRDLSLTVYGPASIDDVKVLLPQTADGKVLAGSKYSAYVYLDGPMLSSQSAPTAVLTYNTNSTSASIPLSPVEGTTTTYALKEQTIPAGAATLEKITFTLDSSSKEATLGVNVVSHAVVTFSGDKLDKTSKELTITQGDTVVFRQYLGYDALETGDTGLTIDTGELAAGSYSAAVTGTVSGRPVTFGSKNFDLSASEKEAVKVTLTKPAPVRYEATVTTSDGTALSSWDYDVYWYHGSDSTDYLDSGTDFDALGTEANDLYVQAVPSGYWLSMEYDVSAKTKVESTTTALTLPKLQKKKVSGTVTLDGEPLPYVTVVVSSTLNGYGATYSGMTNANGEYSIEAVVLNNGRTSITVNNMDIEPFAEIVTNEDLTNAEALQTSIKKNLVVTKRKGGIREASWYGDVVLTTTNDSTGTELSYNRSGDTLYLDDPDQVTGNVLYAHVERSLAEYPAAEYADVTVQLNDQKRGELSVQDNQWKKRDRVDFTLNNPARAVYYALLYRKDDDNKYYLDSMDTGRQITRNTASIRYLTSPLIQGEYTFLFLSASAYREATGSLNTLTGATSTLNQLGSNLYVTASVTATDKGQTFAKSLTLPSGTTPSASFDLKASGLTLEADGSNVAVRLTAAPTQPQGKKGLFLRLETNQTTANNANSSPDIIPGSLYINGRRANTNENGDVQIEYVKNSAASYFNGVYTVYIENVNNYGGWPAVVQWESGRTNAEGVTATALAAFSDEEEILSYLGEAEVEDPLFSMNAPTSVGTETFYVYGTAPKGAVIDVMLDGAKIGRTNVNDETDLYTFQVKLDNPVANQTYTLSATAKTTSGGTTTTYTADPQVVVYTSTLPYLSDIQVTDYSDHEVMLWNKGWAYTGYYYYLPNHAFHYTLTFGNVGGVADPADLFESVTVCVPRSDGVVKLPATYKAGSVNDKGFGVWETEGYVAGNNPPTGAWVDFKIKNTNDRKLSKQDLPRLDVRLVRGLKAYNAKMTADNLNKVNGHAPGLTLAVAPYEYTEDNNSRTKITDGSTKLTVKNVGSEELEITSQVKNDPTEAANYVAKWSGLVNNFQNGNLQNDGALYFLESGALQYSRLGYTNNEFYGEQIYRYNGSDNTNGSIWVYCKTGLNKRTEITVDTGSNNIYTNIYTNTDINHQVLDPQYTSTQAEIDKGDTPLFKLAQYTQRLWATRLVALAGKLETATGSGSTTADTGALMDGQPPYKVENFDFGGRDEIQMGQDLIKFFEDNGAMDSSKEIFWSVTANRQTAGGGYLNNLKWSTGEQLLQVLKDRVDLAFDLGPKIAEEGLKAIVEAAWDEAKENMTDSLFGPSVEEQVHLKEMQVKAFGIALAAEEKGQKIDWSNFPMTPDLEDVRNQMWKDKADQERKKAEEEQKKKEKEIFEKYRRRWGSAVAEAQVNIYRSKQKIPTTRRGIIDPSGYVYEAVPDNRLEGVTATIYQVADSGTRTLWNAAQYDQDNPNVTGSNGEYQWMVPSGKWSVTFSKTGYADYTTGEHDGSGAAQAEDGTTWYMPVAPAQLDVNINLQRADPPRVESVTATEDAVYIVFDQYMKVSSLKKAALPFTLLQTDGPVTLALRDVTFPDAQQNGGENDVFARTVKLATTKGVGAVLQVDAAVESYTGKKMTVDYIQGSLSLGEWKAAEAPTVSIADGAEIESTTPVTLTGPDGARLYYTTDGSTPSVNNGTLYTGPLTFLDDTTLKVVAVQTGKADSEVTTVSFTIKKEEQPDEPVNPWYPGEDDKVLFEDVPENAWYRDAVYYCRDNGLFYGVTETLFRPKATMTRAMFTTVLYRLAGEPPVAESEDMPFEDVKPGRYYTDAVIWGVGEGVVAGVTETRFAPDDPVTREQIAALLWRYEGRPQADETVLEAFTDADCISAYARPALAWAVSTGLMVGKGDGLMDPKAKATRAEVARIVQVYHQSKQRDGILR